VQRAEMFREIQRLREMADQKTHEAACQADKLAHLNAEIARTQQRCDELNRLIEQRSHELHAKGCQLDETTRELARTRDGNAKVASDNACLMRDNDRLAAETHDIAKEL